MPDRKSPVSMPDAAESAGRSHAAFREVNNQIAKLSGSGIDTSHRLFVCECADTGCAEALEITEAEYEAVRADGARFVVVPGHHLPGAERVVDGNGRFLVVETLGDSAAVVLAGREEVS